MKSKVAFLDQARKMPNTSTPALHLKRNIFECFRFFNFPFSIQFWRLNPSTFSSDFFCGEISAGIDGWTCLYLPVVGEELEPGARTLSWRPEEERRGGLLGRSSLGTHHSVEHPRQVWQRRRRRSWHLICLSGWAYFSEMSNIFVNMSYEICCT